ncbi:MAG: hypothetical protein ABIE94_05105, partial [archaeon]
MKRIIFIPIEPLIERYSANWLRWFPKEFDRLGINYVMINPRPLSDKIRDGSFLDISGTHYYKAMQLAEISRMIYNYQITDNDVFFIADAWYSGIEALAYMRDGLGLDFKIAGILFAGTYDPNDFLTKKGMEYWGKDLENSWLRIYDKIFVGSDFHKRLICSTRDADPKKISVVGHPSYYEGTHCEKENIIVFPHRLDEEKNPHLFDSLSVMVEESFPDWKCIKTKEVCKTKQEYLDLLERAK